MANGVIPFDAPAFDITDATDFSGAKGAAVQLAPKTSSKHADIDNTYAAIGTSFNGTDVRMLMHVYGKRAVGALYKKREQDYLQAIERLENRINILNQKATGSDAESMYYQRIVEALIVHKEDMRNQLLLLQNDISEKGTPEVALAEIATLQTLSISSHRSKAPVRSWGAIGAKGYTRGSRTIGGTMIFTVFDRHTFFDTISAFVGDIDAVNSSNVVLADQMPPFDVTLVAATEYGHFSRAALFGIELMTDGVTVSVQDIFTEQQYQYIARDYKPFEPIDGSAPIIPIQGSSGQKLDGSKEYEEYKKRINPFL